MKKRSTCRIGWLILGIMMTTASSIWAATWYVSTDGSDGNAGTNWATAKATIQAGIDVASSGDRVLVAPGRYVGTGNKNIEFRGRDLVVKSVAGADQTIIDCEGGGKGVWIHGGETRKAVLDGFTVTDGYVTSSATAPGIMVQNASPTIMNCSVVSNYHEGVATDSLIALGIGCYGSSSPKLVNCVVAENTALIAGGMNEAGAIFVYTYCEIVNCTIVSNTADTTGSKLAAITVSGPGVPRASVVNSIVWGNAKQVYLYDVAEIDIQYSCVQGGFGGAGNTSTNPLFVSTTDYHLRSNSPCIDAGSASGLPQTDLDGRYRLGHPDMGAFEFVSQTNRDFVTYGYGLPSGSPRLDVLSVSNRFRSNLIDIDYRVTDSDSAIVEVRGYATPKTVPGPEVTYMDTVFPITVLAEGTQVDYGDSVVPTNAAKRLVWDASADIGQSTPGLRVELMASDASTLPVSMNFITIPADTNGPAFRVSQWAFTTVSHESQRPLADRRLQRALVWALVKGLASKSGTELVATGGTYDGQTIAQMGELTETGRLWLVENLSGVRLATALEIQRARDATTAGKVTRWASYYRPGTKVNEFGIDTTDDDAWYLVKE